MKPSGARRIDELNRAGTQPRKRRGLSLRRRTWVIVACAVLAVALLAAAVIWFPWVVAWIVFAAVFGPIFFAVAPWIARARDLMAYGHLPNHPALRDEIDRQNRHRRH